MIYPKIVRGGNAIPIGENLFLMKGRKHKNGGIDIGKDLEVEGDEVMQTSPDEIKVFSAQKFLGGESPADLVLAGANPDRVFAAQEQYKDKHKINDDGTKKKAKWGIFEKLFGKKKDNIKTPVEGDDNKNEEDKQKILEEYFGDVKSRQAYAESKYDVNAKNSKNAYGIYQIRPIGVADYNRLTGENITHEDVLNLDTALKVRDTLMDSYWNRDWINNPKNENDTVRMVKTLMAYNMGPSRALETLNNMKSNGVNIYNVEDLIRNIPVNETKNYVKFVATGESISPVSYLNDSLYQTFKSRNSDLDSKIRVNKKFGGMSKTKKDIFMDSLMKSISDLDKVELNNRNNPQLNGVDAEILDNELNRDILLQYSPSTGKQIKACGGRKKARYGSMVIDEDGNLVNIKDLNGKKINENATDIYYGQKKLTTDHWLSAGIGAGTQFAAGLAGSLINNATNRKYLNRMEELIKGMKTFAAPVYKLKTNYDVNPQLSEVENQLGLYTRDVNANTASSSAALNRLRNARAAAVLQKNKLYGLKENEETKLINQDILNQQQQMQRIAENEQNVYNTKQQLLANLEDKRSENATATIQGIVGSTKGAIDTIINGANSYEQLLAGLAASPNGSDAIYGQVGKSTNWRKKAYKKKDDNGQS